MYVSKVLNRNFDLVFCYKYRTYELSKILAICVNRNLAIKQNIQIEGTKLYQEHCTSKIRYHKSIKFFVGLAHLSLLKNSETRVYCARFFGKTQNQTANVEKHTFFTNSALPNNFYCFIFNSCSFLNCLLLCNIDAR